MKKSLFLLTAVAVTLFSCEKEQDFVTENPDLSGKTVTVKASHEADAEVKTTVDGSGNVEWQTTDKLSFVYDGGSAESNAAGVTGTSAEFTATLPGGKEALYLVYPSSVTAEYESSSLKVTVSATQNGTFASAAIEVAEFAASCNLKNLGAILAITTTADVDEIVISSNNSTPLAGTATVSFTDGIPSVSAVASGSTSVTLSGLGGPGTYYAAVLPDSYAAGIYVELKKSGSVVGEKISGNALTAPRRKIMRINVGDPGTIGNKYFFKADADGTGTGLSWDSPGDITLLDAVLSGGSDANLFLAQGVYNIGDIDGIGSRAAASQCITVSGHKFTLYGGYPTDATGTSLSGRNTAAETAISGEDTYRILLVNNASASIAADGMTFKNAYYAAKNGYGSALVLEKHAGAKFTNCTIKNNQTATEASAYGGAVRAKYNSTFVNCNFLDNLAGASSGGAIFVPSAAAPVLTIDNCTFSGNRAPAGTGGAILIFGGTIVVKNSTFTGSSSGNGGVLRASSSTAISASFTGCAFNENYSTNAKQNDGDGALAGSGIGGAVFSLNGASGKEISLTLDNCEFVENVAHPSKATLTKSSTLKGAGGIASVGQYSHVRMKDCLIKGNHAGMASFIVNANSSLYLNRCRLWENRGLQDATVVYNNGGKVAFHNCSIQNSANLQTQTDGHTNCFFYNTDGGSLLLSCCSFRAASVSPLFRGGSSTANNTAIINNVIASTNTTGGGFESTANYTSHGHNIVTTLANWTGKEGSDLNYTATASNPAKNSTYFYLKASLAGLSFTKATRTDVTTAISTFDTNNSTGVLTWLGADAVTVDVMKNPRGATEIMPGCYEGD